MKSNHLGKISLWKFIFCILIILFHISTLYPNYKYGFKNGSIGVEFFFLVSGFFFAKKCINYEVKESYGEDTFNLLKSKVKQFFLYVLLLAVIGFPYLTLIKHYTITKHVTTFYKIFLIPSVFDTDPSLYGILWYLTAMIIVEVTLFPLVVKYKKNFIHIVSPIIVILLLNYMMVETNMLVTPWAKTPFAYKGIIRAFMEINLGMYLYLISENFNKLNLTKLSKVSLCILEILLYSSIFYITNINKAHPKFDVLMLIIISIGLLLSANPNISLTRLSNNKVFYFLERLSLPMYIYQWVIIYGLEVLLRKLNITTSYPIFSCLAILILIFISIIVIYIIKFYEKHKQKLINIFIES